MTTEINDSLYIENLSPTQNALEIIGSSVITKDLLIGGNLEFRVNFQLKI